MNNGKLVCKNILLTNKYNSCFYSSFIFLINVFIAYYYKYYIYSFLFLILFITSIIFHTQKNKISFIFDKISIILIVIYGGYLFYNKIIISEKSYQNFIIYFSILSTFVITIYLFYYGYYTKNYCYCDDEIIANYYHSFLHILSSIGHIFIMIL
jgi:hypothetical protein